MKIHILRTIYEGEYVPKFENKGDEQIFFD